MRIASIHCPHCDTTQFFWTYGFPRDDEQTCRKCEQQFELDENALIEKMAHVCTLWAATIVSAIMAIDLLRKLPSIGKLPAAVFVALICGLGVAFFVYLIARPLVKDRARRVKNAAPRGRKLRLCKTRVRRTYGGGGGWHDED